jgi:hypothetical protein
LTADYEFQGTLASSVPGAPALTDAGPGANAFQTDSVLGNEQQVLAFPKDNGLALTPASSIIPSGGYSIVMLVRLHFVDGYRRLIDFANGTLDNGFYVLSGGLALYPDAGATGLAQVPADKYVQIALTRSAGGVVDGYIGQTPAVGPYDDSTTGDAAITSAETLRFFIDDASVSGEDSDGAVARIRIYDGVLSAAEIGALAPAAPPVQGKAVDVGTVSGQVLVKLPGQAGFQPLSGAEQIPVGATVDATHGRVRLTSAANPSGRTQSADFYEGAFRVGQKHGHALTTLDLSGGHRSVCARAASSRAGPEAIIARGHPIRRLWGSGKGRYTTRGSSASATVRGTTWLTEDFCDGTLVRVRHGTVVVRDFARHATVVVHAHHSYFARAR